MIQVTSQISGEKKLFDKLARHPYALECIKDFNSISDTMKTPGKN
jgi:hypothetical protein